MTKRDLTNAVAACGFDSRQAASTVEAVFNTIIAVLERGEDVSLVGFGQFHVRRKAARRGRDLRTGAPIEIAAGAVVRFRPSRQLKQQVN